LTIESITRAIVARVKLIGGAAPVGAGAAVGCAEEQPIESATANSEIPRRSASRDDGPLFVITNEARDRCALDDALTRGDTVSEIMGLGIVL
jgi:hypothetical protein